MRAKQIYRPTLTAVMCLGLSVVSAQVQNQQPNPANDGPIPGQSSIVATDAVVGAKALAESQFSTWDRGALRLGGFVSAFDSTLAFGLGKGADINLDAEKLLGLDSNLTVFRADALYRLGESRRHRLDFSYASFNRSAATTLT